MLKKLFYNSLFCIIILIQTGPLGALFAQTGSFSVFNSDNSIIGDNRINVVLVDQNVKWVGSAWGLYSFNDNFWVDHSFSLPNQQVRCLSVDNNGYLWVGTLGGGVVYDGESWAAFEGGPYNSQINSIVFNNEGVAFVGTIDGLYKYDDSWSLLLDSSSLEPFINVTCLAFSGDSLCIGTMNGGFGYYYDGSVSWENTTSGLIDNSVFDVSVDENNNKWLATPFGGLAAHLSSGSWLAYNSAFFNYWPSNSLLSTFIDNNGLLWVGSQGGGFFSFSLEQGAPFTTVYNTENSNLPSNIIYDIVQDNNNVYWLGTQEGLVRWNQAANINDSFLENEFNGFFKNKIVFSNTSNVSIYNLFGQKLIKKERVKQINLNDFSSGTYIVEVNGVAYKVFKY